MRSYIAINTSLGTHSTPVSQLLVFYVPKSGRIVAFTVKCDIAPTGGDAEFDLLLNGSTALVSPLELTDGNASATVALAVDIVELSDFLQIDLLSTPSDLGGLSVWLEIQIEEPIGAAAQITSNQNNYQGAGLNTVQRWSSDASRNVTGFEPGGEPPLDGQIHYIINEGSADIVLKHQDAASTAALRYLNTTGADITLSANRMVMKIYDDNAARWRVTLLP